MRNKLFVLLAMLLIGTLVLAACGGGAPDAAPQPLPRQRREAATAAPAATEEPAATEAPARQKPRRTEARPKSSRRRPCRGHRRRADHLGRRTARPILENLGAEFTKQTGVKLVVVQKAFGDIRSDFITAAPTGSGPDIILGAHDWIGELNASGLLAPVELGPNAANFAPNAVQAFTYTDGKLYGMPQATENIALIYNTDLVPTPPTTFDEVKTMSKAIKDAGTKYGFLRQTVGDPYHFYPIQTAFGGYIFGQNADGSYNAEDLGLNSEGSVAALEWLNSMYEDGLMDRNGNIDGGLMLSAFQNGDAAMVISGPWAISGIQAAGVPYAVANIPTGTAARRPLPGRAGLHGQRLQQEPAAGPDLPPDLRRDRCHHAGFL